MYIAAFIVVSCVIIPC